MVESHESSHPLSPLYLPAIRLVPDTLGGRGDSGGRQSGSDW